jgi:hypothetical protein
MAEMGGEEELPGALESCQNTMELKEGEELSRAAVCFQKMAEMGGERGLLRAVMSC